MMKEPDLISNMRETQNNANNTAIDKIKQQQQQQQQNVASTNSNANNVNTASSIALSTDQNNNKNGTNSPIKQQQSSNLSPSLNGIIKLPSKKFLVGTHSFEFSSDKVKVLKCDNQIKELHTVLRDRETSQSDFKFYSDRLIRLLVEQGLNELPYTDCNVTTPAGCIFNGIKYIKAVCGVSIMRSGEAMEKGLRECCRSIRIGKILIQTVENVSSVVYAKFPNDIQLRKILLMYPITTTGSTINLAIKILKEHGVSENNIILLCLFSTPAGLQAVHSAYPEVNILTSEIHTVVPTDFGQRYFGTE